MEHEERMESTEPVTPVHLCAGMESSTDASNSAAGLHKSVTVSRNENRHAARDDAGPWCSQSTVAAGAAPLARCAEASPGGPGDS